VLIYDRSVTSRINAITIGMSYNAKNNEDIHVFMSIIFTLIIYAVDPDILSSRYSKTAITNNTILVFPGTLNAPCQFTMWQALSG
jgi:hypothetical protein